MNINWQITQADIKKLKAFVSEYENDAFVLNRIEKCLGDNPKTISKATFWHAMVSCLLTTQQRSGPDSPVNRLITRNPFPLSYEACRAQKDLKRFVVKVIGDFGGLRRKNMIAEEMFYNLGELEKGLWTEMFSRIAMIQKNKDAKTERQVAEFIASKFKGFGSKQSRNLLQSLGLTKYETPLDSRITKWLNEFGFPIRLSAQALSNPDYYNLVMDGVQALCKKGDIYPCVLDAAIFTSFDEGKWKRGNIMLW